MAGIYICRGGIILNDKTFSLSLQLTSAETLKFIMKKRNIDEVEAAKLLYSSKLYKLLEDEETKMWHFSGALLADLLNEEIETGDFEIPIEG